MRQGKLWLILGASVCVCALPTSCPCMHVCHRGVKWRLSRLLLQSTNQSLPIQSLFSETDFLCHMVSRSRYMENVWAFQNLQPPVVIHLHLKQAKQHAVACSCNQKTALSKPSNSVSLCTWLTLQYRNQASRLSASACVRACVQVYVVCTCVRVCLCWEREDCDLIMREEDFLFNRSCTLAYLHSNDYMCIIIQPSNDAQMWMYTH